MLAASPANTAGNRPTCALLLVAALPIRDVAKPTGITVRVCAGHRVYPIVVTPGTTKAWVTPRPAATPRQLVIPGRLCGRRRPRPTAGAARPPSRVRRSAQLPADPLRRRPQRAWARPRTRRVRVNHHPGAHRAGRRAATEAAAAGAAATSLRPGADRPAGGRAWVCRGPGVPGGSAGRAGVAAGRCRRRACRGSAHGAAADGTDRDAASAADRQATGRWRAGPAGAVGLLAVEAGGAAAELGFAGLSGYLQVRYVEQRWPIKRMRAELRVGRNWLVADMARLGLR